jgi:ParB-like chromosome segregation protein Spo0J
MTDPSSSAGLTALADRLELWPIERLRPYDRNPRTHSDDQVAQIAASMVEFGWTNPILIDETDGILAGHGCLQAAKHLGLSEAPELPEEPVTRPGDL